MKWLVTNSSKTDNEEMSHYLRDYCHSSFTSSGRPGWKWRLVWASFPVTWDFVYSPETMAYELVFSWTLCCRYMYSSSENRNWKTWLKFMVVALKHFILYRETEDSMSLYLHQLFPHLVEQSWWLPCSATLSETTEHAWVNIKTIWPHCHSATDQSIEFLVNRWISYREYSCDWQRVEAVQSHVQRKCEEWRNSNNIKQRPKN